MAFARHLARMALPIEKRGTARSGAEAKRARSLEVAANADSSSKFLVGSSSEARAGAASRKSSKPPPEFSSLLGHRDGVIDGFGKLVRLVVLLSDKERESSAPSQNAGSPFDEFDDDELDRQIAAELDRIAARHAAEGIAEDSLQQPAEEDPGADQMARL
jgi:hypothetical protein